jgi:hypothetical protein
MKTSFLVLAFGLSGAAWGQQQPQPVLQRDSAGAGASGPRCERMSRQEMLFCQTAKQTGARGVRDNLCEAVSAQALERCLIEQESVSSDPRNEFRNRKEPG